MIDPNSWGLDTGFWDVGGTWREAQGSVIEAVLAAMGADEGGPPPPVVVTVRRDHPLPPVEPGLLVMEQGGETRVEGRIPDDVPSGYHRVYPDHGEPYGLVVSPGQAPLPARPAWGFSSQLYATRSLSSWGLGDLSDLDRIGRWSAGLGAGLLLVNPLHASSSGVPQQPSPYYPGSRCFMNPINLAVEQIPGSRAVPGFEAAAKAGRALNARRLIDRDMVWRLKSGVLEALFRQGIDEGALDSYLRERGELVELFATFCAISEIHGASWHGWPDDLHHPGSAAVRAFRDSRAGTERILYHSWLQWLTDQQLARAGESIGIVQDLAVGVDPGGADAWIWQEELAPGVSVGAPPDEFATLGQNWGLPPFDPWRLRSAGYQPWIEALRAGFRCSAGLRVDHVMGIFRLYWIPQGYPEESGLYVRYPHHDMLNILTLEAERAGAFVVGEDLGTVEDGARSDLLERRVLSYRVWWFEPGSPETWPQMALGTVTTHDLPTIAGVLSGSDLEVQRRLGLQPNEEASLALREKVLDRTGWQSRTDWQSRGEVAVAVRRVHEDLSKAPCVLLAATLDDVAAVEERPNMPGTVDEWPNWCLALPLPLEELELAPLARQIAAALSRGED